MKIQLTGKVIERTSRKMQDGTMRYYIVIEEPGNFPAPFQFSAKSPDLFGPSNGFAAVGNIVTASGFANGRCDELQRKDGNGTGSQDRKWCCKPPRHHPHLPYHP